MKRVVKSIKKVEDCFDGSMIYEITLHHSIDTPFITFLDSKGDLDYYSDFPKPLFRMEIPALCQLTGCLGAETFRAVLYRENLKLNLTRLESMLETFQADNKPGTAFVV